MAKLLSFGSKIDFEKLDKAIKERDRFLEKNPHMEPHQMEIDRLMRGAGSSENRMAILAMMMNAKLLELQEHCKALIAHAGRMEKTLKGCAEKRLRIVEQH